MLVGGKREVALTACRESCGRRRHVGSQDGSTALVLAAWSGHKDTVELLLDRGANLEAKTGVRQARLLPSGAPRARVSQAGRGPRWPMGAM